MASRVIALLCFAFVLLLVQSDGASCPKSYRLAAHRTTVDSSSAPSCNLSHPFQPLSSPPLLHYSSQIQANPTSAAFSPRHRKRRESLAVVLSVAPVLAVAVPEAVSAAVAVAVAVTLAKLSRRKDGKGGA